MATIEQIYASIIYEGVTRKYHVIPEFCVTPTTRLFQKKIDIVWLEPRNETSRLGSLRYWKILAAFEIEGCDVPVERIQVHSNQFTELRVDEENQFPCFVALYSQAHHRADPNWGYPAPEIQIQERIQTAQDSKGVVQIIDGRDMEWLKNIKC